MCASEQIVPCRLFPKVYKRSRLSYDKYIRVTEQNVPQSPSYKREDIIEQKLKQNWDWLC
jgi:hypothetical protein